MALSACAPGGAPTYDPDPDPPSGLSVSARDYLNEVLGVMEANSLHRLEIDWQAFRDSVFEAADGARSISGTYPGIRVALRLLGDGHSQFHTPGGQTFFEATRSCTASPVSESPDLPPTIGYVRVRSFGGSGADAVAFAEEIQDSIRARDRTDLAGWIVDLRGNTGGNMWPMIAGVGPILGEGEIGRFVDPEGDIQLWQYQDGAAGLDGRAITTVPDPYQVQVGSPPVAVLTDNRVMSSGEAVAVAFRGRAGARSFGTPTCGLSTANVALTMSDGALLVLTVSRMGDRSGVVYGDEIPPDETEADRDEVVHRAAEWIGGA